MTKGQRLTVAWIGLCSGVGIIEAGHAHHREIVAGLIVGVTCVMIGWLL